MISFFLLLFAKLYFTIYIMFSFLKNIGTVEIIIIGLVIVLFFGGRKLNELARGLGESKKEFKKIQFSKIDEVIPAMIIIVMIAVSYKISMGLALGFISFVLIKIILGKFRQVKPAMWIIAVLSLIFLALDQLPDIIDKIDLIQNKIQD